MPLNLPILSDEESFHSALSKQSRIVTLVSAPARRSDFPQSEAEEEEVDANIAILMNKQKLALHKYQKFPTPNSTSQFLKAADVDHMIRESIHSEPTPGVSFHHQASPSLGVGKELVSRGGIPVPSQWYRDPLPKCRSVQFGRGIPHGLPNDKYYCYLNSVIQLFAASIRVRSAVAARVHQSTCPHPQRFCVGCALEKTIVNLYEARRKRDPIIGTAASKTIEDLRGAVQLAVSGRSNVSNFDDDEQQCADEFFSTLLDVVMDAEIPLNKETSRKDNLQTDPNRCTTSAAQLFGWVLMDAKTCNVCQSKTYQNEWQLSLRLRPLHLVHLEGTKKYRSTVQEALDNFFEQERYFGGNDRKILTGCDTCHKDGKEEEAKTLKHLIRLIAKLPSILVVVAPKMAYDPMTGQAHKVSSQFDEVNNRLILNEHLAPNSRPQQAQYQLSGGIVHTGRDGNGHYYAVCRVEPRRGDKAQWYEANDKTITMINEDSALKILKEGALLLYDRIGSQPPKTEFTTSEALEGDIGYINGVPDLIDRHDNCQQT